MFRLLKVVPPNGWRAVWWELGIVTLGVLVALLGEQVVGSFNARSQLADFRQAANEEVATNLYAYRYRVRQGSCVARRIAELERWRDRAIARGGVTEPLLGEISRPSLFTMRTATWDSRGEVINSMPFDERLNYAEVYAVIGTNYQAMLDDRDTWRSLSAFSTVQRLDTAALMRINEALARVKSIDETIAMNYQQALDFGQRIGVAPHPGRRAKYMRPPDPAFCRPILPA